MISEKQVESYDAFWVARAAMPDNLAVFHWLYPESWYGVHPNYPTPGEVLVSILSDPGFCLVLATDIRMAQAQMQHVVPFLRSAGCTLVVRDGYVSGVISVTSEIRNFPFWAILRAALGLCLFADVTDREVGVLSVLLPPDCPSQPFDKVEFALPADNTPHRLRLVGAGEDPNLVLSDLEALVMEKGGPVPRSRFFRRTVMPTQRLMQRLGTAVEIEDEGIRKSFMERYDGKS